MENNIKVGKQAKDDMSESSESSNSSSSGKEYSKSCSCSSCRNKKSSKSESPSKNESEKDSLKISKKKNKKDEKKENNTKSKIKFKINDEKEIIKKNNEKKEKEKEKDNKKKNLKGKVKINEKKEEYNEYKKGKNSEDNQEISEDKQEINTNKKEKEKENKPEIKDRRIRLISYKEAKELDLDKVAYIALTDGSILIVRKDLDSMNKVFATKSNNNLKSRNYISNKSNFCIKGIKNEYDNIFNNIQNMSQSNSIHQIYKRPSFNQNQSQNDIQRQHQPNQNIFPKSEYSFNGQLYANNISLHNQNCSKNVQRINKINTNNTYFYNRYNPSTNSLFKPNRDPQLLKYFSPYKIQNPNAQYINHRHSMSYNNLVQSNNQPLKQYIQIKNTQRQPDRNKYKVIEVIPCNYCEANNSQMLDNSQVNTKVIEPIIYQEVIPSETILSRNNSHYLHQRTPNIIYSPIETNYSENNNCCMFEQELNDCLSNH